MLESNSNGSVAELARQQDRQLSRLVESYMEPIDCYGTTLYGIGLHRVVSSRDIRRRGGREKRYEGERWVHRSKGSNRGQLPSTRAALISDGSH